MNKLNILITTGLSSGDIGGPAQYGPKLKEEFEKLGHKTRLILYGARERSLPPWIRHLYFLLRVFIGTLWADKILTLDTYSVGAPSVLAAKLLGRKVIIRIGGDFLWSAYVNRTSKPITLPEFYKNMPKLSAKERLILFFMKKMLKGADHLAFNTEWQRNIWKLFYKIKEGRSSVVRNFIPPRSEGEIPGIKNFLWAGRIIPEKNLELLKQAGERLAVKYPEFRLDVMTGKPHKHIQEIIKKCYAAISVAFADFCPNFIVEAVSYNKPFVISQETGFNEICPNGGIFVDPLNKEAIERAMEAMLEDKTYNKFIDKLKSVNLSHSWMEIAEELLEIWRKL